MTSVDDTDRRIAAWFADDRARLPERTIEAVLAHARTHPRRPDPLAALRRDPMGRGRFGGGLFAPVPLVAAVGLILVAAFAGAAVGGFLDRPAPVIPEPVPLVTPSPVATSGPKPVVISVDLVEVEGQDASIEITDQSGTITSAESGQPAFGGSVEDGRIDVAADPDDPAVVVLTWTGSPCDTTHQLEIEDDGRTMTLSRPRCEGDAIPRDLQLRLRFVDPVDPRVITTTLVGG